MTPAIDILAIAATRAYRASEALRGTWAMQNSAGAWRASEAAQAEAVLATADLMRAHRLIAELGAAE